VAAVNFVKIHPIVKFSFGVKNRGHVGSRTQLNQSQLMMTGFLDLQMDH
jgi:hypothetical protein